MSARPCLLLVDDTPSNIDILVGLLKDDYEIKIANRGAKALSICEGDTPIDLILLDVMMPDMDGFEVCQKLRAQPASADIPILFLTAKAELDAVVRGFEVGGTDYLSKPVRPAELRARVATHLTLRAQKREIEKKNTELKEMLHILCHDVANHLMVLDMGFDLMESHPQLDLSQTLPYMKAALRNGISLTQMVKEMRRSEDKHLHIQAVPLAGALEEALLLVHAQLELKRLTIDFSPARLNVLGESCALVNSVFCNILTNAIKFSHPGSVIELAVREDEGMACISIRDHGVGMPEEVLAHLFDLGASYSRPGTQGESGTGFGMPLMRRFVEHFDGRVTVSSRDELSSPLDHGTEFKIWLPLAPDA